MFMRTVRSMRVHDWVLLVAIALVIAFGGVYGWSYGMSESGGSPVIPPLVAFVSSLVLACVVGALILVCNAALTKLSFASLNKDAAQERASIAPTVTEDNGAAGPAPSPILRFIPTMTVKSVALFSLILILFWSPYIVAAFPGAMYNDTAVQMQQLYEEAHPLDLRSGGNIALTEDQIEQEYGALADEVKRSQKYYVTDAWLIDHHPFALTLIYGSIAKASDALFGSWVAGFACIAFFQVIVLAGELAFAVAFLRKKGAPPSLCLAALIFFCIVPIIPYDAVLVMKDTAFTLLFIPYFLMLCDWVIGKQRIFQRKRFIVLFVVLGLLLCLAKKTGVYVVGATALFGLVVSLVRMRRKSNPEEAAASKASALAFFLQGALSALLMFALVPLVVFPAFNIVAGSKAEAIGSLLQQTARVYRDYGSDALTSEERQAIAGILYTSGIEWDYNPTSVDRVKGRYAIESTDQQFLEYLKAYASMGLRFPAAYLESFVSLEAGYLSPVVPFDGFLGNMGWTLDFDEEREVLPEDVSGEGWQGVMMAGVTAWDSIPVLNVLLRGVTYCLWVPALLLFFCLRNRLKAGALFVPFAMVTLFCLVGPVYGMRYLMPEVMLAPVLLGASVAQAKSVFKARADAAGATRVETDQA